MKYFSHHKLSSYLSVVVGLLVLFAFSCKKDENVPAIVHETGTMTDVEGNVYTTVKIGNQWWMAENLKVTKFRNGNSISHYANAQDWSAGIAGYCAWNDESNTITDFPGLLYNWYAVTDSNNIAPTGWHVPTDAEW